MNTRVLKRSNAILLHCKNRLKQLKNSIHQCCISKKKKKKNVQTDSNERMKGNRFGMMQLNHSDVHDEYRIHLKCALKLFKREIRIKSRHCEEHASF